MAQKALLVCGILSSLLYFGADILGATRYEGYSYTSQTISELSAIGAPTTPLIVPLFLVLLRVQDAPFPDNFDRKSDSG